MTETAGQFSWHAEIAVPDQFLAFNDFQRNSALCEYYVFVALPKMAAARRLRLESVTR
jgi:hypothetical protein